MSIGALVAAPREDKKSSFLTMTYSPSDPWLVPLLKRVSTRPGMYLASESVHALALYLQAYGQARLDLGIPEFGQGEETLLKDFTGWLMSRSGLKREHGWETLIHFEDPGDRNVKTFFARFEEYLEERGDRRWAAHEHQWPPDEVEG